MAMVTVAAIEDVTTIIVNSRSNTGSDSIYKVTATIAITNSSSNAHNRGNIYITVVAMLM